MAVTQSKLDADEITLMHYENKCLGDSQETIARRRGVSQATVSRYAQKLEKEIQACMNLTGKDYYDARMEAYRNFKRTRGEE